MDSTNPQNRTIIASMELDVLSVFDSVTEIRISESCPVPAHIREINARILQGRRLLDAISDHFHGERFSSLRFNTPRTVKNQIRREVFQSLRPLLVTNPVAEFTLDRFFKSFTFNVKRREVGTVLTLEELGACLTYSGPRTSLWFEFLYYFGGRVSEACNIRLRDIRPTKRREEALIIITEGKTDSLARVLVPTELIERVRGTFEGKVYLFETSEGKKYGRKTVYNLLVDASERILSRRVTPHDMRRTFGHQMLIEKPWLEEQAMRHGRWSDRNTFRSKYTRPDPLQPENIPEPQTESERVGFPRSKRKKRGTFFDDTEVIAACIHEDDIWRSA